MFKKFLLYISFFTFSIIQLNAQIPLDNLQLWYSADSVDLIGGKVATWYDQSGNDFHLGQSNDTKRPLIIDNVLGGEPIMNFSGTKLLNVEFPSSISQPVTAFIIWRVTTVGTYRFCFGNFSGTYFGLYGSTSSVRIQVGGGSTSYNRLVPFDFILSSTVFNTTSSELYENGILMANGSVSSNALTGFTVGNAFNGSAPFIGDIAEIILYDAVLSDEERDSVENYLMDKYSPSLDIGSDIVVDYGFCDTTLIIDSTFTDILWSTGETNDTIFINQSGEYTVEAKDIFGRMRYDTINVEFPNPNIQNSIVCLEDSILYDSELIGSYSYLWSDLTTDATKYFKDEGDYWLRIEDDNLCFDTVFFFVDVDSFKNEIWLGNDTSLCSGNTIRLIEGEVLCNSFLWTTNGNTSPIQTVNESGWQKIEVENANGCIASDSIYVTIIGTAPTPGYIVENLCFGDTTQLIDNSTPQVDIASWKWIINDNDTLLSQNSEWNFGNVGTQNVELFVEAYSGCSNSIIFEFEILPVANISFTNQYICTGLNVNFESVVSVPDGTSILDFAWAIDGINVSTAASLSNIFNTSGEYNVSLIIGLDNSCVSAYDSIVIVSDNYPMPENISTIYPPFEYIISESSSSVDFIWNHTSNTIFYKFMISDDIDFENIIFESNELFTNSFNYLFQNVFDTLYWKIDSYNPCFEIVSSETNQLIYFNPTTISELSIWLSADSVDVTDAKVTTWWDKSGNENNLFQSNESKRPIIIDNELNNNPIVRFNGASMLNVQFLEEKQQPITAFILWKTTTAGAYSFCFDNYSNTYFGLYSTGASIAIQVGGINTNYTKTVPFNYVISSANYNTTNSTLYENGVLMSSGGVGDNLLTGLTVGNAFNGSGPFQGDIAEIIFYDTVLSDSDRQMVERYLHDKYSPPVNLLYDIRVPYGFCDTAITTAYKPWFTAYEWSTGETDSIIHVNRPGLYSVTVTDIFGFESSDDIRVFYPEVNDFADTVVCYGNSVVWDAELMGDYSFAWYGSSETTRAITIDAEGDYAVIITDTFGCQYKTDTINFSFDNYELTASIGPADTTLCAGNRLLLVSNADETVSWEWSTGSTNSEITLSSTGEYSVTTTNWRGCQAVDTINVTINGTVPVPNFESLGHCAQNPVYFTDLSTSSEGTINSWTWSINGEIFSNEQNPILAEPNPQLETSEPETKEIALSIQTSDGCGDFITQDLTIYPLPVVSFTPTYFCQFAPIEFISTSAVAGGTIMDNLWIIDELQQNGHIALHTFSESGTNTVKLISSSDQGCRDSISKTIFIKDASLPAFSTSNACLGGEIYFVNNTEIQAFNLPLSWEWNFGDGSSGTSSDPSHIYTQAGVYDVDVKVVWQNMCEVSTNAQVEVYNNPTVDLHPKDECINVPFDVEISIESLSGEIISYNWVYASENPIISTQPAPFFNSEITGEYPISLTVSTEFGCSHTNIDTILVHDNPEAEFTPSRVWGAVPFSVEFTNSSQNAVEYMWHFGDLESSSDENPTHIYTYEGEFDVKLYAYTQFGCENQKVIRIKSVNPLLDVVLYNLRTAMNDNYLQTKVYIINNGTLPVNNAEMILNLGDGKVYRENIEYLAPSQVLDYKFKMEVWRADSKVPEVVCVEIYAPAFEGHAETKIDDNIICNTDVSNLKVYQPYPNPSADIINLEYILAKESDVTISLVNGIGKQVYRNTLSRQNGYHKLFIDVKDFVPGVYFLQVQTLDERLSFKLEVSGD